MEAGPHLGWAAHSGAISYRDEMIPGPLRGLPAGRLPAGVEEGGQNIGMVQSLAWISLLRHGFPLPLLSFRKTYRLPRPLHPSERCRFWGTLGRSVDDDIDPAVDGTSLHRGVGG